MNDLFGGGEDSRTMPFNCGSWCFPQTDVRGGCPELKELWTLCVSLCVCWKLEVLQVYQEINIHPDVLAVPIKPGGPSQVKWGYCDKCASLCRGGCTNLPFATSRHNPFRILDRRYPRFVHVLHVLGLRLVFVENAFSKILLYCYSLPHSWHSENKYNTISTFKWFIQFFLFYKRNANQICIWLNFPLMYPTMTCLWWKILLWGLFWYGSWAVSHERTPCARSTHWPCKMLTMPHRSQQNSEKSKFWLIYIKRSGQYDKNTAHEKITFIPPKKVL